MFTKKIHLINRIIFRFDEFRGSLSMNPSWDISETALSQLFDSFYELNPTSSPESLQSYAALVILSRNELDGSNEVLLSKILEAISIDINNCKIVVYNENEAAIHDDNQLPKLVLCFGPIPGITSTKYDISRLKSSTLICCDGLDEIRQNTTLKRALWASLKQVSL